MQQRKQGIWWNCMFYSTGQWHCDDFDRFFIGLPAELQTARALMIIACLMGFLGYVMSNFGLSCSSFMTDESGNPTDAKNKGKSKTFLYVRPFHPLIFSGDYWRRVLWDLCSVHRRGCELLRGRGCSRFLHGRRHDWSGTRQCGRNRNNGRWQSIHLRNCVVYRMVWFNNGATRHGTTDCRHHLE